MKLKTALIVLLVAALPLAAAALGENKTADGNIPMLGGSGTQTDPYIISSADDLRIISSSYRDHYGAYYLQTCDIVFNDADFPGDRISLSLSAADGTVTGRIATNAKPINGKMSASVWINGIAAKVQRTGTYFDIQFDAALLKERNTLVALGCIGGNDFGTVADFTRIGDGMNITAPIKGNFTPIGTKDLPFAGTYDGNGYSITGMKIVSAGSSDTSVGMFGYIDDATVIDTSIVSAPGNGSYFLTDVYDDVSSEGIHASDLVRTHYSGSIAGHGTSLSSIILCNSDATVFINTDLARYFFLSKNDPVFYQAPHTLSVRSAAGGIAGAGVGNVFGCGNAGNVISLLGSSMTFRIDPDLDNTDILISDLYVSVCNFAGGIIGYSDHLVLSASSNSGDVCALSRIALYSLEFAPNNRVLRYIENFVSASGGAAGSLANGSASDVCNTGPVRSHADINHTAASKYVAMPFDESAYDICAGGIIGLLSGYAVAERSYNGGTVAAAGSARVCILNHEYLFEITYAGEIAGMTKKTLLRFDDCCSAGTEGNHPPVGNADIYDAKTVPPGTSFRDVCPDWDFGKIWTVSEKGHPKIWIRNDLTIIDTSKTFDGTVRYSADIEYAFDKNGDLHGFVDRNGFMISLERLYDASAIKLYMKDGEAKVMLEAGANGRYGISRSLVLSDIPIVLYIDGLVEKRSQVTIVDTSKTFDGTIRYSADTEHTFDENGTFSGPVGKDGIKISLTEWYDRSKIEIYFTEGEKRTVIERNPEGRYCIPMGYILDAVPITLFIDGLVENTIQMLIFDTGRAFSGTPKYSVDGEHAFNEEGTLFGIIGRNGFAIAPADDYLDAKIELFMIEKGKRVAVDKNDDGRYTIPDRYILAGDTVTLYIDGLVLNSPQQNDPLPLRPFMGVGVLAFICVIAFIALGGGLTTVNAMRTRSILMLYGSGWNESDEQDEQAG